ncbi:hypothetical protein ACVWXO_001010 [Bradyrhizobium sp. LM2.7]
MIPQKERDRLLAIGADLATVWHAATTMPRDRKELLQTLLEEIIIKVERDKAAAHLAQRDRSRAAALAAGHDTHQ